MTPPPYQEFLFPPSPPAGADFVFEAKGATRVGVLSVMCQLATSAVVGNRQVSLQWRYLNGQRFMVAGTAVDVSEGDTKALCWQSAAGPGVWPVDDSALAGMPYFLLLPGCTMTLHVTGMDTADQLSGVALVTDMYPPESDEPGPVPYPLIEQEAYEAMIDLAAELRAHRDALDRQAVESRRDRVQREALAVRQ